MQKVSDTHSPPHLQSTIVTTAALLHLLYINIYIYFFFYLSASLCFWNVVSWRTMADGIACDLKCKLTPTYLSGALGKGSNKQRAGHFTCKNMV